MGIRKCGTCDYHGSVVVPSASESPQGEMPSVRTVDVCRCDSPKAVLINTPDRGPQAVTIWPQVDVENDFCGRWFDASEGCKLRLPPA